MKIHLPKLNSISEVFRNHPFTHLFRHQFCRRDRVFCVDTLLVRFVTLFLLLTDLVDFGYFGLERLDVIELFDNFSTDFDLIEEVLAHLRFISFFGNVFHVYVFVEDALIL